MKDHNKYLVIMMVSFVCFLISYLIKCASGKNTEPYVKQVTIDKVNFDVNGNTWYSLSVKMKSKKVKCRSVTYLNADDILKKGDSVQALCYPNKKYGLLCELNEKGLVKYRTMLDLLRIISFILGVGFMGMYIIGIIFFVPI